MELALRRGTTACSSGTLTEARNRFPGRGTLGREQRASYGWGFRRRHSQPNAQLLPGTHFCSPPGVSPLHLHQLRSSPKPPAYPEGLANQTSKSKGQLSTGAGTKQAEERCSWKRGHSSSSSTLPGRVPPPCKVSVLLSSSTPKPQAFMPAKTLPTVPSLILAEIFLACSQAEAGQPATDPCFPRIWRKKRGGEKY